MRWDERFIELAPVALFGVDHERTLVFVKGAGAAALFGDEPERWIGRPFAAICAELAAPWLLEEVERTLGGEARVATGEVGQRSFELSCSAGGAGELDGVVCAAKDVTDAKHAEAAKTARAISLLRATLDATDDGMFTVDTTGNVGLVNQRFLNMWHLTEEVMRLPDFRQRMSFVVDQLKDPSGYRERAEQYYAHPERETFDVLEFADGRIYERYSHPQWVEGVCVGRVLSFRDVTQQRRAERQRDRLLVEEQAARVAAQAAERRAAFLAETGTLLASSLDYEATLAVAARRVVPEIADGCIVCAFEDTTIRCIEAVHGDPDKQQATLALAATCHSVRDGVLLRSGPSREPLLVPDVTEAWLRANVVDAERRALLSRLGVRSLISLPLLARGNALGALMLLATAPGRRFGEPDLVFASDLARRVALAVDNARLYGDAEKAVRARDEFLAIASHELRTPLTSLQLTVQTLLEGNGLPAAILDKLRTLERKSRQLGRLISALLDISRSEGHALRLELQDDVDLAKIATDVIGALGEEIRRSRHEVSLIAPRPVLGRWDRLRLEQVLNNLLSNALRHGAGKPITVSVEERGREAVLSVRDQGEGIAPELRVKIFEKFARGGQPLSNVGMGLGLYITRQIVAAHGGAIEVQSEPGAGSSFIVTLPRGS